MPRALRNPFLVTVLLALLTFAVRIPVLTNAVPLPPDGHEYLNVAWNLANGHGFRKTIKWNFYKPHPVEHSALGARPILYSLLLVPVVKTTPFYRLPLTLRILSALMCVGTVVLTYLLFLRLYTPEIALAGGSLLAIQPGYIDIGTLPLTEPLLMLLLALIFYVASRARSWVGWGTVGILIGLAYLTRPNGLFLLPIFIGYLLLLGWRSASRPNGKAASKPKSEQKLAAETETASHDLSTLTAPLSTVLTVALVIGFLLPVLPFWIANARVNGSAFASDLQLAYAVKDVSDATWTGFGRTYTRPLQFITSHFGVVLGEMNRQTWGMLSTLANSLPFLMTFLLFLRRKQWQGLPGVMLTFGFLNLLFYCVSWNVIGSVRYLLPSTYCLLGPLLATVYGLDLPPAHLFRRKVPATTLILALMVAWYYPGISRIYQNRATDLRNFRRDPMYRVAARWLQDQHLPPDTVIASNNPWIVNYYTNLPTTVCPTFTPQSRLREFVKTYRVRYIILFGRANVGPRDKQIEAAHLPARYIELKPKVRIWEYGPDFWR